VETSRAGQNVGAPVESIRTRESEREKPAREGLTAAMCLFAFVSTAAATLIVCGLTPVRPIPEGWHRPVVNRTHPAGKVKAKGASAQGDSSLF